MREVSQARRRDVFLAAACVVLVLGVFSAIEAPRRPYIGYSARDGRVSNVEEASPAATAGLRPGDVVRSINGLSPADRTLDMWRRPVGGEIWVLEVDRDGEVLRLQLSPVALRSNDVVRARSRSVAGLSFLGFTFWAFLASPSAATTALAVSGLSFGLLGMGTPHFASLAVRYAVDSVTGVAFVLGWAAVTHFLLLFPSRRPFLDRGWGDAVLYAPPVILALLIIATIVLPITPGMGGNLLDALAFAFLSIYFLWALGLLLWRYAATPRPERRLHGLNLMLGSVVVVIVPFLVFAVVPDLWPASRQAYERYSPYAAATFGVIPFALSIAAVRSSRLRTLSEATPGPPT
jgi:hypothetical protein